MKLSIDPFNPGAVFDLRSQSETFRHRLVPLNDGRRGLLAQLSIRTSPDAADADLLHIRASDETLDRYGEVIVAHGWRLETYQRNPVIQNAHQYGDIIHTIGRAERTWVQDNALHQTWRFASEQNPYARIARDLYRGGFLHAASVGFVPLRWENGNEQSPFRRKYLEQELLEVSAVGIPANPNALALALKSGAVTRRDLVQLTDYLESLLPRVTGAHPLTALLPLLRSIVAGGKSISRRINSRTWEKKT